MSTNTHATLIDSERHSPYRQIFANSAARLADSTTYVADDLYKTAYQVDTDEVYTLTAITPTWTVLVGGGGGGGEDLNATLTLGNITGGVDILLSNGDSIISEDSLSGVDGRHINLTPGSVVDTDAGSMVWGPDFPSTTRGAFSVDMQGARSGVGKVTIGDYSTALGRDNAALGEAATAIGSGNTASGDGSVAMGGLTSASGALSIALNDSTIALGENSMAIGDTTSTSIVAVSAMSGGLLSGAYLPAQIAWSSGRPSGVITDAPTQLGVYSLLSITTNATTGELQFNDSDAFVVRESTTYMAKGMAVARQTGGASGTVGDSKSWEITAMFKRSSGGIGASTTTLLSSSVVAIGEDAAASSWAVTVTVNDTTETFIISVDGEVNKNIIWHCTLQTSECSNQ